MSDNKPELTIKACIIGVFLAILLCGANTYLGLKLGTTISASIPAAIISLGILRMFKKYSVLENNISQTIASAGEGVASMVIFIFPALLILGTWQHFNYFTICLMAICGGAIGIVYSVLLRRALLGDKTLPFPEGQAIGQVLLATTNSGSQNILKTLISGISISGLFNFCQSGLQIFSSGYQKFVGFGKGVIGTGIAFSPAAIGAGYLIGLNNGLVIMISVIATWFVFLPIMSINHGINPQDLASSAFDIWKQYIRPIGIGVFIFSGLSTILFLLKPIITGIKESIAALGNLSKVSNTDLDLNIKKLIVVLIIACIPVTVFIFHQLIALTGFAHSMNLLLSIGLMLLLLVLGFIIASVAGYFAGLVGSSNSPGSALLFIAVITLTLTFLIILRGHISENQATLFSTLIAMVGFIGFTAIITNENIQDYKSGQLVGATPYKQQMSLFLGVIFSAFVAPLFIELIFQAYGIAGIVPHAGIDPNSTLSAPQAAGIAMLTKNIIHSSQDWNLLIYGIVIGFVGLALDLIGRYTKKFRCPIIAIGMGIYLPPSLAIALFAGGLLKYLVTSKHKQLKTSMKAEQIEELDQKTNLFICGLIAGESLIGLFLAVPFVLKQSSDALKIVGNGFAPTATILGAIVITGIYLYTYRLSYKK